MKSCSLFLLLLLEAGPALAHPGHGGDVLHWHGELLLLALVAGLLIWRCR